MPAHPTPSAYQEAIQFPADAFRDPALQHAVPDENALGLPQPITGNFAAVFPMTARSGQRWAVKCFLTDVPRQQARYRAIANHLAERDLECMVEFDYQADGIVVDGRTYPILKMAWADGLPLNRFVAEHLDAPDTLAAVSEAWADLLARLRAADIAHGDLQHGNILVDARSDGPRLTLVDYDAMVVPGLDAGPHPEVGHRNYQHPDRNEEDVGLYLDRFPGLVIFTALRACIERPALWAQFDTGENMLFRDTDFYDPSASMLFETLSDIDALDAEVEALRGACYREPETVPTLEAVQTGAVERPAWYERQPRAARRRRADRRPRTGWARWFAPGAGGVVATVVVLAATGELAEAVLSAGIGLGALIGGSWRRYRQVSIVRHRRRLRQEMAHFDTIIRNLERQVASLQAKRREVYDTVDERRAERLAEAQEEALYDRLKHHFIGEVAGVEGVTHKHVVRLKKANIRTAYEATPERLEALRTLGDNTTARINMWRAALVTEYEDALPDTLSPAEERRIQRYVQRRIERIDAEIRRAREKIRVQQVERDRMEARLDDMPPLSFGRYLRYLLRLSTLPEAAALRRPASGGYEPDTETGTGQADPISASPRRGDQAWWADSA